MIIKNILLIGVHIVTNSTQDIVKQDGHRGEQKEFGTGGQTMTSDRDRLIELFNEIEKDPAITCPHYKTDKTCDTCKYTINNVMCNHTLRTVDHLLANGVIVPPCKVGDTLWILFTVEKTIESREIESIMQRQKSWTIRFTNGDCFTVWDNAENEYFGKTVFLTKEEAEEKLKELGK